jgi:hypothetical protein
MDERERDAIALNLKEEGNAFFKSKDFPKAIEKYSEAMVIDFRPRPIVRILAYYSPIVLAAIAS